MADTTEATATAAGQAAEAPGMPQLDFSTFPNQIFWLFVALVALYLILSRVALPRIAGILADRHTTITNDIAMAEELKLKAHEAEAAYEKALRDARAEAGRIAQSARDAIQADLDEAIAKADTEIAEKSRESERRIGEIRDTALQSVEEVAKDTTGAVVAALGAQADDTTIAAAVEAELRA